MPTSSHEGKPWALEVYRKIQPATVVDIGAGQGTYAHLMRPHHKAHWTAVEAWAPYVERYQLGQLYNLTLVADARDATSDLYDADLVIAGDVLEHMARHEAVDLLATIRQHARHLLVSIPVLHLDQDAVNGNPYERHVDHWTYPAMLEALGPGVVDSYRGKVLAYYHWAR